MPNQGGMHQQHAKHGKQGRRNDDRKREQQASADKKDASQMRGGSGNFAQGRERAAEAGRAETGHKGSKH